MIFAAIAVQDCDTNAEELPSLSYVVNPTALTVNGT